MKFHHLLAVFILIFIIASACVKKLPSEPGYNSTKTITATATAMETGTAENSATSTVTVTETVTDTVTQTCTLQNSATSTATVTETATETVTETATKTATATVTETSTPQCGVFVAGDNGNWDITGYSVSYMYALSFTAGTNQTITDLAANCNNNAGSIVMGLYSDNGGVPGTLKAQTTAMTPGYSWNTAALSSPQVLTPGSVYWIVFSSTGSGVRGRGVPGAPLYYASIGYSAVMPANPVGWITDPNMIPMLYAQGCK